MAWWSAKALSMVGQWSSPPSKVLFRVAAWAKSAVRRWPVRWNWPPKTTATAFLPPRSCCWKPVACVCREANLGTAAIAEIHAAIVDLRQYQPVIGVVAGSVGCFGGMSIAAGLCSYLLVTQEARLGLNGPQVIEQEAGIDEYDSRDRPFIWSLTGGEQRFASALVDGFAADDVADVRQQVSGWLKQGVPDTHRSSQYPLFLQRLASLDTEPQIDPQSVRTLYQGARS